MMESETQPKKDTFLKLMDQGLVMVHLDPRKDGVVVPSQFKEDLVLRLNIAYGFNLPALDVDEDGVYAVLSFSGRDFGCTLPWDAVFAMTMPDQEHEGTLWPSSLPEEWKDGFSKAAHAAMGDEELKGIDDPGVAQRAVLRVVDGGAGDSDQDDGVEIEESKAEEGAPDSRGSRSHLRIVKG